ncbi:MAG: aminoacetone oxidase family FAD-binding enzyme [Gemmatimonadetes bacterium]|nr:aminoacetone oxidase family FAD-binding enzyme [Gemmatimonadota bacterium]
MAHPVVVIGAGAAGLLAALTAARRGVDVVLVESTEDGGRKILISGGGRCNILPSVAQPERYVTASSPNTLRKILRSWPLPEQRAFLEAELRMPLVLEEETGKLFPSSQRARDVRDGLLARVREAGVRTWFGTRVTGLSSAAGGWTVELQGAPPIEARGVIVATGGLSVPNTGSDGAGLSIVRALGHVVNDTYPALTPLTAAPHPHAELAGVATDVTLSAPDSKPPFSTTGALLVTHRGWSGPAVLDASHLATRGRPDGVRQEILVNWAGSETIDWDGALRESAGTVRAVVAVRLPRRLADALVLEAGVAPETPLAQLRRSDRQKIADALTVYPLPWTGHEGYQKAEVTGGGVALAEIDPRTMESRRTPGLYLCGEILDAFGPIGGHNFLWAWATGRAAGSSV